MSGIRSTWIRRPSTPNATAATSIALLTLALAAFVLLTQYLPELAHAVRTGIDAHTPPLVYLGKHWFWAAVTMTGLGVGLAATADTRPRLGPPPTAPRPTVLALGAPLLVAGVLLVGVPGLFGEPVSEIATVTLLGWPTAWEVLGTAVVPATIVATALTTLFVGGIHHRLRDTYAGPPTVAATALAAGFTHWLLDPFAIPVGTLRLRLAVVAFAVAITVTPYVLVRFQTATTIRDGLTLARVGVLAVATVFLAALGIDVLAGNITAAELAVAMAWFVVFAVASAGYERGKALVWAIVTLTVFQTLLYLAPYIEYSAGLAG
ncbi:MAG: hypothetical protein ABEJ57_03705 [Halobacteriaceae archaeon]